MRGPEIRAIPTDERTQYLDRPNLGVVIESGWLLSSPGSSSKRLPSYPLFINLFQESEMSTVRTAILGCGGMAGGHARTIDATPDAEFVAGCDVSEDVVQGFIDRNVPEADPAP